MLGCGLPAVPKRRSKAIAGRPPTLHGVGDHTVCRFSIRSTPPRSKREYTRGPRLSVMLSLNRGSHRASTSKLYLKSYVSVPVGWLLPQLLSGQVLVSLVIDLPTVGGLLYTSLRSQGMYVADSIVMLLRSLTVVGTFVSDILLLS